MKFKKLTLVTCIILFSGCDSATETFPLNPFTSLVPFNQLLISVIDTDVDALLRTSYVERITDTNIVIFDENAKAAFTIPGAVTYPNSVKVNQFVLSQDYSIYSNSTVSVIDSPQVVWVVNGYDSTFVDTTSFPAKISVIGTKARDTVSKMSGFSVSYSGTADSNSTIVCYVRFDKGLTHLWKDSVTASKGSGSTQKTLLDLGSVSFTAEELQSITEEVYITIELIRFTYHVAVNSKGRKIGVLADCSTIIPLYLKP